jgi:hypothetical protein
MQNAGRVSCCRRPCPCLRCWSSRGFLSLARRVGVLHPCRPFPRCRRMSRSSLVGFSSVSLYAPPLVHAPFIVVVVPRGGGGGGGVPSSLSLSSLLTIVVVSRPCPCRCPGCPWFVPPVGHWSSWWLLSSGCSCRLWCRSCRSPGSRPPWHLEPAWGFGVAVLVVEVVLSWSSSSSL